MKNISIALNIVLIIAVAVLYYLHFSGGSSNNGEQSAQTDIVRDVNVNSTIVHVNMDSLQRKYVFYKDIQTELAQREENARTELATRSKAFQDKYVDFQEKVAKHLVTRRQAEEMEKQLLTEQQELQKFEYEMSNNLMTTQQIMTSQLYDSITSFLGDYNKKHQYKYILGYMPASALLFADDQLDITEIVIDGLNKRYEGDSKKKKEE